MVIELSVISIKYTERRNNWSLWQNFLDGLKVFSSQKRGSQEGLQSIGLAFLHNRRCFLDTLNGLLLCFQKTVYSLKQPKTGGVFFDVDCVTKYSEALLLLVAIGGVG
jgi:hypothetical protein